MVPGIDAMWANVGGFGAWLAPHNHHPQAWSGVYYVSGAPAPTPGEEDRGGQIAFVNPNPVAHPRSERPCDPSACVEKFNPRTD